MIDVHAPEHRISGKRDFFLHLFTITIGLLIALGLENAAEAWHHREQRIVAEQTIREEIEANREHLTSTAQRRDDEMATLGKAAHCLEDRAQAVNCKGMSLGLAVVQMDTAAWRTAGATGVLQYMDYRRVQKMSAAYTLQDMFVGLQQETVDSYLQFGPYLGQMVQGERSVRRMQRTHCEGCARRWRT